MASRALDGGRELVRVSRAAQAGFGAGLPEFADLGTAQAIPGSEG